MGGRFVDAKGALIIWRVESVEEARSIAQRDPLVAENLVTYDIREWPPAFDYTKSPPNVP